MRELGASQVVDHTISRFEDVVSEVEVVINLIGNLTDQTSTRSLGLLELGGLIVSVPTGGWPSMADQVLADLDPADPDRFISAQRSFAHEVALQSLPEPESLGADRHEPALLIEAVRSLVLVVHSEPHRERASGS